MKDSIKDATKTWDEIFDDRNREREQARKRERETENKTVFGPKTETRDCDSVAQSEKDTRKDATNEGEPSEEDTARLHVALKDPPNKEALDNGGEVMDEATKMHDGLKEEFIPDFVGSEVGGDGEEGVGSDLDLDNLEGFGVVNEKNNRIASGGIFVDRDAGAADPDRERLTDVDSILDKTESPISGTIEVIPAYEELNTLYHNLKADYDRLVDDHNVLVFDHERLVKELYVRKGSCCQRSTARENVYKLLDGERDYQNHKFGIIGKRDWTPNDWLTLIDRYMIDALDIIADPDAQMVEIRKIAALAAAAMEQILTPARV